MDNQTQSGMPEYVNNLPKAVQDVIFQSDWENRTIAIGKKYSLNDNQIDILANTTLFVLIGIESPDTFLETIIRDLVISRLLGEQIVQDLETRVFEYALNIIESKKSKPIPTPITLKPVTPIILQNTTPKPPVPVAPQPKPAVPPAVPTSARQATNITVPPKPSVAPQQNPPIVAQNKIPEVRPNNLPAQTGQPVKSNALQEKISVPQYIPAYKPNTPVLNDPSVLKELPKINPEPSRIVPKQPEPIQQPVSVPRFTEAPTIASNLAQSGIVIETPKTSKNEARPINPVDLSGQNTMDNKLSNVTANKSAPGSIKHVDPYREPLD